MRDRTEDAMMTEAPGSRPWMAVLGCALIAGVYSCLIGLTLLACGRPADLWTWSVLGSGLAFALLPALAPRRGLACGLILAVLAGFFVLAPHESSHIQDIRGGRYGVRMEPLGLRFSYETETSRSLAAILGPIRPEWRHHTIRSLSFGLGDWRDGHDRHFRNNLVSSETLPKLLRSLPDDGARRQVASCLTDIDNPARFAQSGLLIAYHIFEPPPGLDRRRLWEKIAPYFVVDEDPEEALLWSEYLHDALRSRLLGLRDEIGDLWWPGKNAMEGARQLWQRSPLFAWSHAMRISAQEETWFWSRCGDFDLAGWVREAALRKGR